MTIASKHLLAPLFYQNSSTHEKKSRTNVILKKGRHFLKHNTMSEVSRVSPCQLSLTTLEFLVKWFWNSLFVTWEMLLFAFGIVNLSWAFLTLYVGKGRKSPIWPDKHSLLANICSGWKCVLSIENEAHICHWWLYVRLKLLHLS